MSQPKLEDFENLLKNYASSQWDLYMLVHNAGSEGTGRLIRDCGNPEEWQR